MVPGRHQGFSDGYERRETGRRRRIAAANPRSVAVRGTNIAALLPWPHDPRTCGPASGWPRAVGRCAGAMYMPA